jgi:hypothetical protein
VVAVRDALVANLRRSLTDAELETERAQGCDLGLSGAAALIREPLGEALPA